MSGNYQVLVLVLVLLLVLVSGMIYSARCFLVPTFSYLFLRFPRKRKEKEENVGTGMKT